MSDPSTAVLDVAVPAKKRLDFFERYLTIWVLLCLVVGVAFGKLFPDLTAGLSKLEFGQGSQVNVPIGILLWLMIYPMMLKVDFGAIGGIARRPKGLLVTLFAHAGAHLCLPVRQPHQALDRCPAHLRAHHHPGLL